MADDGFSIGVEGLEALQAKLTELSTKQAEKAIRKALRAGAEIEQAAIAERAPVKVGTGGILPDGALKNDIVIKMKKDDGGIYVVVTPDKYTAYVAKWVEYGHRGVQGGKSRKNRKGGYSGPGVHTHDVPEHPFIRPAFEATKEEVAQAICTTLAEEIEKASKS
jgi:HK97 gp10 family phage protein